MRIAYIIICLLVLAAGALFGALNPAPAPIDFYFHTLNLRLGLGLLLAGLGGALVGGLCVWIGVVVPLRARLKRSQRDLRAVNGRAELAQIDDPE